jgi:hypothetical protein
MRLRTAIVAACLLIFSAAFTSAQVVNPPAAVQFDHPDFASAVSYQIGYYMLTVTAGVCNGVSTASTTALYTDTVTKPTTTTGIGMVANLTTKPVGCYVLKVRALDTSGLYSPWSVASTNAGERDPTAPTNTAIK